MANPASAANKARTGDAFALTNPAPGVDVLDGVTVRVDVERDVVPVREVLLLELVDVEMDALGLAV